MACCPALHFCQPIAEISKTASLRDLLARGENIAMTHELFSRQELTPKVFESIRNYGYTLFLDEVLEVIEPLSDISKKEVEMLFAQKWITVEKTGAVRWLLGDEPTSRFKDIRTKAKSHTLIWYGGKLFMWIFPQEILQAFDQVYVLTFLFGGSHMKHFLDLNGIGYSLYHIQNGILVDGLSDGIVDRKRIASLIDVYDGNLNDIGSNINALSKSWFENRHERDRIKVLVRNARNMLMNRYKAASNTAMWTCFKSVHKRYAIKDYAGGFVPCNARASNAYRDRDNLAYLLNVFDHPYIVRWFADQGVRLDQDAFALSQLLQWVWRSAIRDNKPIRIYIPSKRMRMLLLGWLGKTTP